VTARWRRCPVEESLDGHSPSKGNCESVMRWLVKAAKLEHRQIPLRTGRKIRLDEHEEPYLVWANPTVLARYLPLGGATAWI
jgi:hypothetical protein